MKRIRAWRRRAAALALLPAAAATATTAVAIAASGASQARLSASEAVLDYGEPFRLGGRVPGEGATRIRLSFRPSGSDAWRPLDVTRSDARGRYGIRVRAHRNGAVRAVPTDGHASAPEAIRVRAHAAFHVSRHSLVLGDSVGLRGLAKPGGRRGVKVTIRGRDRDMVRDRSARHGGFALRWRPRATGTYLLRAYVGRNRLARPSHSPARRVTVFRYAGASWYGPGLYGNHTACGQVLSPGMVGVAHRSLPCGTRVTLRYRGRSLTVPVIDRGPFVAGREYDLTEATKNRLRFPDVGTLLTNR